VATSPSEKLSQKKSLGQVFLKVEWPTQRMVARLRELGVRRVVEIGPGPGNLTRDLLQGGLAVTAIEKDFRFAGLLADQARHFEGAPGASLEIVNADILRFDLEAWLGSTEEPAAIVGNIPYNISSPILLKALDLLPGLKCILFMTQLEFAQRVEAKSGTKDYGSLSVYTQLRADVSLEFKVERALFKPVPKVDSAVILVTPSNATYREGVLKLTEQVTRAAFSQRRKMLRNSIKAFLDRRSETDLCPLDLDRRADAVSPQEFVALAEWLHDV
jgi:16S rRNA (adenine1518-N6/adenine1519-N6)-dimethyltransferase